MEYTPILNIGKVMLSTFGIHTNVEVPSSALTDRATPIDEIKNLKYK